MPAPAASLALAALALSETDRSRLQTLVHRGPGVAPTRTCAQAQW